MSSVQRHCLRATMLVGLLWSGLADAQEPASSNVRATLVYRAFDPRSTCPDEAAFQDLVTARLGYQPFAPQASRHVRLEVAVDKKRLLGRLVVQADLPTPSVRELRAGLGECEALVEALSAATSLMLDPDAVLQPPAAPSAPPAPPAPATEPVPPIAPVAATPAPVHVPPPVPTPTATREAIRPDVGIAALASVGLLPGVSLGGQAHAGIAWKALSAVVLGRAETQPTTAAGETGVALDSSLFAGGVAPCATVRWLSGCLIGWIGSVQGRAPHASMPSLGSSLVAYVAARVGVEIPLGHRLSLAPHLELSVPVVRTTLLYDDRPEWTSPAIAGSFGIGLTFGRIR